MFDLVLKNAKIVCGAGNPWFYGDIGIKDSEIKKIGPIKTGRRILDIRGMIASPGFIDIHTHSDLTILVNPRAESKVLQGVTTEVIGNCGLSVMPVKQETINQLKDYLGFPSQEVEWDWKDLNDYCSRLKECGISINIAPLIGHGTLRIAVMGFANRRPKSEELDEMKNLLRKSMERGAFGLSTGLIYPPGSFTEMEELIELVTVLREYDGLYATHIRGEGSTLLKAVKEALRIGQQSNVRVEISHHKASGKRHWGKVNETLRLIEKARKNGIEVTCDQYPYTASSTTLSACLPIWVHEGNPQKLLERLRDPRIQHKIRDYIENEGKNWENIIKENGWGNILISSVNSKKNKDLEGKSLEEAAQIRKEDPFNLLFNLLLDEEGDANSVFFDMSEEDVRVVMNHPTTMFGSDGRCLSPTGPLSRGSPHPRNYGTYPRILGKYVRDEEVLILERAIRKMTSFPAQKLGIKDRGLLKKGYKADIVVFDPNKINDTATYESPHQFPRGIEYVMINGEMVVENGEHTGKGPGEVLRKS